MMMVVLCQGEGLCLCQRTLANSKVSKLYKFVIHVTGRYQSRHAIVQTLFSSQVKHTLPWLQLQEVDQVVQALVPTRHKSIRHCVISSKSSCSVSVKCAMK